MRLQIIEPCQRRRIPPRMIMLAGQDLFVIIRQSGVGEAQVAVLQLAVPYRQHINKQQTGPSIIWGAEGFQWCCKVILKETTTALATNHAPWDLVVWLGLPSGRTARQKSIYEISSWVIKHTVIGTIRQLESTTTISFSFTLTNVKTSVTATCRVSREEFYPNKRRRLMKLHLHANQIHSQGGHLQAMAIPTMILVKPRRYWSRSLPKMELLKSTKIALVISNNQSPSLQNSMARFLLNLSIGESVEWKNLLGGNWNVTFRVVRNIMPSMTNYMPQVEGRRKVIILHRYFNFFIEVT